MSKHITLFVCCIITILACFDKNGNKFGMNVPNTGNKQLALNLITWLGVK